MLGAIIGDMVGSIYEFDPIKSKEFNIYDGHMRMTDDSLLTLAVARVLINHYPINYSEHGLDIIKKDLINEFVYTWKKNRGAGWGGMFNAWCASKKRTPYNSYGNGSAMRISPIAWVSDTEEHLKLLSKAVTEITHNHPEGIKGAEAVAMCIFMALHGASKEKIRDRMIKDYYPEIKDLEFENLVRTYQFSEICQKSVPQAIYCFLISESEEDAIRNCVAIGGDCDTTGAMAGAIAEAFYNKDKSDLFEDKFIKLMIDKNTKKEIKAFHKMIGSYKF